MTKVINIKDAPKGWESMGEFVYIGRAGKGHDGYFGNPFKLRAGRPRGSTIANFAEWVEMKISDDAEYRERVKSLAGKTLVCFCKPLACHGDVLAREADRLAEEDKGL